MNLHSLLQRLVQNPVNAADTLRGEGLALLCSAAEQVVKMLDLDVVQVSELDSAQVGLEVILDPACVPPAAGVPFPADAFAALDPEPAASSVTSSYP